MWTMLYRVIINVNSKWSLILQTLFVYYNKSQYCDVWHFESLNCKWMFFRLSNDDVSINRFNIIRISGHHRQSWWPSWLSNNNTPPPIPLTWLSNNIPGAWGTTRIYTVNQNSNFFVDDHAYNWNNTVELRNCVPVILFDQFLHYVTK